jgi:hypothetical protein
VVGLGCAERKEREAKELHARKVKQVMAGRRDANLKNVIISEKRDKKVHRPLTSLRPSTCFADLTSVLSRVACSLRPSICCRTCRTPTPAKMRCIPLLVLESSDLLLTCCVVHMQFERSTRVPIGPEWNTFTSHQALIKPAVIVRAGAIIEPIAMSTAQENKLKELKQQKEARAQSAANNQNKRRRIDAGPKKN